MSTSIDSINIAMVCSSNINRSMEAHYLFLSKGVLNVSSFGTSVQVKLPGPTLATPNTYDFKTTYAEIYRDLVAKDEEFYRRKGLLSMIHRNMSVKQRPQRFQDVPVLNTELVFTFEDRVYDMVLEDLLRRNTAEAWRWPIHLINFTIKDCQDEAILGVRNVYKLYRMFQEKGALWADTIDTVIDEYQENSEVEQGILHSVMIV